MGIFTPHIARLQRGETARFRPTGHSMTGRISSGDLVVVEPYRMGSDPAVDDVVLCRVKGVDMLHLVTATRPDGRYQISNNHGHVNGWTGRDRIYGRLTAVNPPPS